MNNASWWAKKLNNEPPRYAITLPPQPVRYPAQVEQQPAPQPAPQPVHQHTKPVLDPNRPESAEVSMGDAMRLWQGGEAHKKEGHLSCPSCGSSTGYTAYSGMNAGSARVNGQQPRPHCFECGYNGSFAQGLETSWA